MILDIAGIVLSALLAAAAAVVLWRFVPPGGNR